jgi:hypothetical protein
MTTWVFVVTAQKVDGKPYSPHDILNLRFKDSFWGLGESTPNRKLLKKGDQVVFYLGIPIKSFTASAVLASDAFQLDPSQKQKYSHDLEYFTMDYGVLLEDLRIWESSVAVDEIVAGLSFIKNKENWGAYFQGGIRQIPSEDFVRVTQGRKISLIESIKEERDIESESEFALEAHLEEFIDQNWAKINFGQKLVRFTTEEQSGRQYPAGQWSIDFLCKDAETEDLVVVELKRGRTSDATVGQILRYIGWVQENIAKPGQNTRGIIIASGVDDALRLAVRNVPVVKVMTYKVDFLLRPAS